MEYGQKRWYAEKGDERARCVVELVNDLATKQQSRKTRAMAGISLYEGKRLASLSAGAYCSTGALCGDDYDKLRWNIPRSLCQTVQAKISGKNKPKVQFVVTDGDWSAKRKAKKRDKFVEAQMHLAQGGFSDCWQLMQSVVLYALVVPGSAGIAKVFADYDRGKICIERVAPWEVYVDPQDAKYAAPRSIFHRYPADRDALESKHPGKTAIIQTAKKIEAGDLEVEEGARAVEQVWVYEAWHLGDGKKAGVHVSCVDGGELEHEEWKHDGFPFLVLRWAPELLGYWSQSLTEEVEAVNDEVNATLESMAEGQRKLSSGVLVIEDGSVPEEDAKSNDYRVIRYTRGRPPPQYTAPVPYSESTVQWLQMHVTKEYELPGVSQMSATSRKEPGVTAAVAMRTLADIETERFSVFYGAYEQLFVDLAKLICWAAGDLAEEYGDLSVNWPGQNFLQTLNWKDLDLPEDMYVIRPYAVSGIKNTPADRLSLAQDLVGANVMSQDAFSRVVQFLDTPGEFKRVNQQREWVGKLIEQWLDTTPDDEDFEFHPPIRWMVLEDAILQVAEEYFGALMEGVPDYNAQFFLQWMELCDKLLQERAQRQAALMAPGNLPPGSPTMAVTPEQQIMQ